MTELELYHWGIKGMRWGVRRYQNKDGSLTPAGKKRYADDPDLKKVDSAKAAMKTAGKAYSKAFDRYSNVPTNANWKRAEEARDEYSKSKIAYNKIKLKYDTKNEVSRIRDNDIQFKNKSKHRLRLEDQYKKMGMSDEEAQAAANNRIRTEKILAASATVAVAACAAYVIRNKIKDRTDGLIKAGDTLQRIEMKDTGGKLHDMFYVSKGSHDNNRYEGMLGMVRKNDTGHAYMMKLKASGDVKVASKDNAVKTFKQLYLNDQNFRKSVEPYVESHFAGFNKVGNTSNYSAKNMKKMYENFNSNLLHIRDKGNGADKVFFDSLKSKGYGAIQDINDMKFSGYNAKNPLIVFDNSKQNILVSSVKELTGNVNKKGTVEYLKAAGEGVAKDFVEIAGPLTAGALTVKTVNTYRSDPNDEVGNKKDRRVG
jgi:hypothetical protein